MSAGHTSGPWQASDVLYQLNFRTFVNVEAEGEFLAAVSSEPQIREITLANARLIAAAPDLLEAAIEGLKLISCAREDGKAPTKAECLLRLAIAKATGPTS